MQTVETAREPEAVSATGGSARSQLDQLDERRWKPRRAVAFGVAATAFLVPFACAVAVVQVGARIVPRPNTVPWLVAWLVALAVVATATMYAVDRQARRLMPLAAMLRLSLVFPDHAPSRFAVALRTGSGKALERALARGAEGTGEFATPQHTAELVVGLIGAVNAHDRLTRGHCERVRAYSDLIGQQLELDADRASKLHWAALLHDVGKLDVPSAILNKKGRLTADEWSVVRGHPGAAAKWLTPLESWLGEWARAATEHHERFDGDGYPNGLAGEQISLAGRIVAVADAFDVMTAARSYKKPYPAEQARTELAKNAGTQFDPKIVRAFLAISLGKLRLVMGPVAWLSGLPVLLSAGSAVSSAGTVVTAAAVAASGLVAPATPVHHARSARPAHVAALERHAAGTHASTGSRSSTRDGRAATTHHGTGARAGTKTTTRTHKSSSTQSKTTTTTSRSSTPSLSGSSPSAGTKPGTSSGGSSDTTPTSGPSTTPTGGDSPATVVVSPAVPVEHAPVANPDTAPTALLGTRLRVPVLDNDTDADGDLDPSTLQIVSLPPSSDYTSIGISNHQIDIRPAALYTGTFKVGYQVCDKTGLCASSTLTVKFVLSL